MCSTTSAVISTANEYGLKHNVKPLFQLSVGKVLIWSHYLMRLSEDLRQAVMRHVRFSFGTGVW